MTESTITPGMETPYRGTPAASAPQAAPQYSPYGPASAYGPGTVVPGMAAQNAPEAATATHNKPLMGFLYSVSRVPTGEFWPVYQGNNVIGRGADCDIVLPETSVSGRHATLLVRKNVNPEKVIAAVTDMGSTVGTMLNGVSLDFTPVQAKSGDIITIGENYELLFLLVDASAYGLKVADKFSASAAAAAPAAGPGMPPVGAPGVPSFNSPDVPRGPIIDGTVGLDGMQQNLSGGTTF